MAVADKTMIVDGQTYYPGDTIPDLGSWVAISASGNIRNYNGLSADVAKLPHYVGDGSSALCVDTGDYYKYLKSTDTWYKL